MNQTIITAALSIQDVRERPAEHKGTADEMHRRFEVPGSDFLGLVQLWDYLREQQQALSGNQFRKLCKAEFLHYLRVREWTDLYSQLRQVAGQIGIRRGATDGVEAGHPDRVHQALLSGLLSHPGRELLRDTLRVAEHTGGVRSFVRRDVDERPHPRSLCRTQHPKSAHDVGLPGLIGILLEHGEVLEGRGVEYDVGTALGEDTGEVFMIANVCEHHIVGVQETVSADG